jgi:UDP-N-acetylglucosamine 2-epimerase
MRFVSIVGARPEFIQAAPVSRVLRRQHQEILIHTGQHYDYRMSRVFFEHLQLPEPDIDLEVGSGSHGEQTGEMLARLEHALLDVKPDAVIIRGDTNSTLVGALAASSSHIPLIHIEAGNVPTTSGCRRSQPVGRRSIGGHVILCHPNVAVQHLAEEGIIAGVYFSGDVMLDALQQNLPIARTESTILSRIGLPAGYYLLATVHRASNTDSPDNLRRIVSAFNAIREPIVFPVHPRTRAVIDRLGLSFAPHVLAIEPVGYLDMLALESNARAILTDSGGVQREAYFLAVPCVTLREETELTETVQAG